MNIWNGDEHLTQWDKQKIQQHPATPEMLGPLLLGIRPDWIMEIGTGTGLFTLWLSRFAKVVTYDIEDRRLVKFDETRIRFCKIDYKEMIPLLFALGLGRGGGPSVVICDGGNKKEELKFFVDQGYCGWIMAHDYERSNWPFCELKREDIPDEVAEVTGPWNTVGWFVGVCNRSLPHTRMEDSEKA